jgi:hypothetical protein
MNTFNKGQPRHGVPRRVAARTTVVALAAFTALAHGAFAQPPSTVPIRDLDRVQQGVGDIGPAGTRLAQPPPLLRVPTDFSGVYRIPSTSGSKYAGWYARVGGMGGLVAVFPRSVYERMADGTTVARLPPGTRFLVGGIPRELGINEARVTSELMVSNRVDQRVDARLDAPPMGSTPASAKSPSGGPERPIDGRLTGNQSAGPQPASAQAPSGQAAPQAKPVAGQQPQQADVSFQVLTQRLTSDEAYRRLRLGALAAAALDGL